MYTHIHTPTHTHMYAQKKSRRVYRSFLWFKGSRISLHFPNVSKYSFQENSKYFYNQNKKLFLKPLGIYTAFPHSSVGKESACNAGDLGSITGLGRSPGEGKGYLLHYSGLENSMDHTVHGVAKSGTQLSNFHFHFQVYTFYVLSTLGKEEQKRWYGQWSNTKKLTNFLMVTHFHGGKDAMESLRVWLGGPWQDAIADWIQDPNTLGSKKSRERLLFKNPNFLDQVRQIITDAERVKQRTWKEKEVLKWQTVAGWGANQTNNPS